jgi:hypothetical protein
MTSKNALLRSRKVAKPGSLAASYLAYKRDKAGQRLAEALLERKQKMSHLARVDEHELRSILNLDTEIIGRNLVISVARIWRS